MNKTYRKISGMILLPAILLYIFVGEICQAGTVTYNYIYTPDDELVSISESDGNSTKVTNLSYDPNGNLTAIHDPSSKVQGFGYNDLNQLIRYVDQAEGRDFSYLYNAESLRSKKINASTNKQLSFYYDSSGNVVNEADGTDMSAYLMAHDRLLRAIGTDIYWYVRNGKDIVGTTSDGTKQNNTYAYTAYGKDINLNSAGNSSSSNIQNSTSDMDLKDNPFKYSATYQDFESGLYYMKARYYSPELMRFISKDTYDLSNKYAYGNGNPISNYDPSGHNALSFVLAIGALVTAAVSTILTFGAASPSGIGMALAGIGLLSSAAGAITEGVKNGMNSEDWNDWSWKSEDTLGNVLNIVGISADIISIASVSASIARSAEGSKISSPLNGSKYKNAFSSKENFWKGGKASAIAQDARQSETEVGVAQIDANVTPSFQKLNLPDEATFDFATGMLNANNVNRSKIALSGMQDQINAFEYNVSNTLNDRGYILLSQSKGPKLSLPGGTYSKLEKTIFRSPMESDPMVTIKKTIWGSARGDSGAKAKIVYKITQE